MFDWWEDHFMAYGVAVPALIVAGLLILEAATGMGIPRPSGTDAASLLSTLASIAGGLLGFSLAAATIAGKMLEKPSAWRVRSSNKIPAIWAIFVSATKWLGALTLTCVTLLIVDSSLLADPRWAALVLFVALVAVVRIARCVWILEFFMRNTELGEVRDSDS